MTDPELDHEGLYIGAPGTISTFTGKRVDPLDLQVEDIDVRDIAHALARQCRYNGHVEGFLTVARHSIWVSERLGDPVLSMWGLLHDAAEAYLGDLVRPLKHGPVLGPVFQQAEHNAERVIAKAFDLPFPMPLEVLEADRTVLNERELPKGYGARYTFEGTPGVDEDDFLIRYNGLVLARTLNLVLRSPAECVPDIAGRDV